MVDCTRFDHFPKEKLLGNKIVNHLQGTNICLFYFAWTLMSQYWCFPTHINNYLQNAYFYLSWSYQLVGMKYFSHEA
jgi:hypothetical protein